MTIEEAARLWAQTRAEKREARQRYQRWPAIEGRKASENLDAAHHQDHYGRYLRCYQYDLPQSDWCEVCRLRHPYYQAYRLAIARESGARRRLFRLASVKEENS